MRLEAFGPQEMAERESGDDSGEEGDAEILVRGPT